MAVSSNRATGRKINALINVLLVLAVATGGAWGQ